MFPFRRFYLELWKKETRTEAKWTKLPLSGHFLSPAGGLVSPVGLDIVLLVLVICQQLLNVDVIPYSVDFLEVFVVDGMPMSCLHGGTGHLLACLCSQQWVIFFVSSAGLTPSTWRRLPPAVTIMWRCTMDRTPSRLYLGSFVAMCCHLTCSPPPITCF